MESLIALQYCYDYLVDQISIGLLLYTHLPTALIAFLFGSYLIVKERSLPRVTLFIVCLAFLCWSLFDLTSWFAFLGAGKMMTAWSLLDLISILFFCFTYYFLYTFITNRDLPLWQKIAGVVLMLPTIVATIMGLTLSEYDANSCEATRESLISYYPFIAQGIIILASLAFIIKAALTEKNRARHHAIVLAGTGVIIFLGFFFTATFGVQVLINYDLVAEYAYNYEIYGLFGMPILLVYLGYLIVRYHALNIKIFGAQALVIALLALIGSQLAFVSTVTIGTLVVATLILTLIGGVVLVRSVRREIEQRERIEQLAKDLQSANERQEGLLHFVSHEVKGFLTKDMSAFAALIEGDMGALPETMKSFVQGALAQSREGARSVIDLLQASNQKKGTVEYKKIPFDLAALTKEWVEKLKPLAEKKSLALTVAIDDAAGPYTVVGDGPQMGDHVLRNLIENSINYTLTGSVTVSLAKENGKVVFAVADTGVGISDEDKQRLFTEGGRGKDSIKVNVHSTGYGLFIAKNIVDAHGGTIRAESEGVGKGSRFVLELPAAN